MAIPNESELASDVEPAKEENKIVNPRVDIITAVTLMGLCLLLFFHALSLPRPDNSWTRAPGGMLLVLAVTLFFMALSLLFSAIKLLLSDKENTNTKLDKKSQKIKKIIFSVFTIRQITAIGITCFYIFILLGRIYFEFSSIIYLFLIIKIFWKEGSLLRIFLISVLAPIVFSVVFTMLLSQSLPGGSLLYDILFSLSRRGV